MKSINPDPLTPDQAIDILHRAAAAEGAPIFKDCADVIVSLEKLRTQNEALTKQLAESHAKQNQMALDMIPTTEEAVKWEELKQENTKLRTRNQELREALTKEVAELKQALAVKPISPAWEIAQLRTQNRELVRLLREVIQWHSHPESPDYNGCDKSACHWCSMAQHALAQTEVKP